MSGLADRIAERIRREGPLRFDLYQEAALYDPEGGYYERAGRVGRTGDFITAPTWHPAFARCLAEVAGHVREAVGGPIDVVDVGAGEGELLGGLREALRGDPEGGRGYRLVGVERSATRRERGRERLPSAAWLPSIDEVPRFTGLLVAYELFDALPVRALLFEGERLVERAVDVSADGSFLWAEIPCDDSSEILRGLGSRGAVLRPGQLLEIRPAAQSLALALAGRISRGLLLVFDYGAPARALYGPARRLGTLESFRGHRVTRDVLSDPGSRDITAWVDFTDVEAALRDSGFTVDGLVSQARFLAAAGIGREIAAAEAMPTEAERIAERHALGELVAPGGMGESIRVLVASRGVESAGRFVNWPVGGIVPSNH